MKWGWGVGGVITFLASVSRWCGEPFSWPVYWWTETRTRSHSSTYRNNWPSVDWVQSIHSKTARKPIRIDWGLLARVPMEVCQSQHSNSHEDNQPAQLAAKVKKKTKCAVCVVMGVIGKTTFKKNMYGTTARRKNKNKTTLNAYWFRQILDKNNDEYATQATFSLSYFDAMTHIMRAEPIPNDVKFHIILGQNCMKTQAKYVFFPKTPANFHIILRMLNKKRLMPPTRNEL